MYRSAVEAFELSLSINPKSHETERDLNSLIAVLHDMTIVLGDASILCPELVRRGMMAPGETEETKEEATERRLKEQDTVEVLKRMERSSKEREMRVVEFGSRLIKWKLGYAAKVVEVEVAEEKEREGEEENRSEN